MPRKEKVMNFRTDRLVHGMTNDGGQIVRYNRAGKWYIEYPDRKRRFVDIRQAVDAALTGTARLGLPGGGVFDRLYRTRQAQS